jgi:hypothetical protein
VGGGGSSRSDVSPSGLPGTVNTGGGGAGSFLPWTGSGVDGSIVTSPAGAGGSGIVILRFTGDTPTISAGLTYTETVIGDETLLEFTAGTGTVTW